MIWRATFDINPQAKQSTRFVHGRCYTDQKKRKYVQAIALLAHMQRPSRMLKGPLAIRIGFTMPDRHKVDCDNLSKPVLDALKDIVYGDDSQIVSLTACKLFDGVVGIDVEVEELEV